MKTTGISIICVLACASAHALTLSLDPPAVEAGRGSVVAVSGQSRFCAPIISHVQASMAGTTLNLSAAFEENPAADCLPGPIPFSADFPLPPLDAGTYTVLMRILPACSYSATPCPFAAPIPDTGRLYIQDPAALHYRIDPDRGDAERNFRLKLTGTEFQCGSGFDSLGVEVKGRRISLRYRHHPHPEALCSGGSGFGPVFDMAGLEAGTYQVFAVPRDSCSDARCAPELGPANLAGALVASYPRPLAVSPRKVRSGLPFELDLNGTGFACGDSLSEKRAELKEGAIHLHYFWSRSNKLCVDTLFIGHAAFSLPALPLGSFPVFLDPGSCASSAFLCAPDLATRAVDTVVTFDPLGLHPGNGKSVGGGRRQADSPRRALPWRGGTVDFSGRALDAPAPPR